MLEDLRRDKSLAQEFLYILHLTTNDMHVKGIAPDTVNQALLICQYLAIAFLILGKFWRYRSGIWKLAQIKELLLKLFFDYLPFSRWLACLQVVP